ncbi:MAG: biopolymer transporter ExbD [Parachlamydiales bacterium]|nr:biopolymer transporter ExbD [Parachlamydiales bacterium]
MSLIPDDKLHPQITINLTPMIDFLFLMLAFFATLAVTRSTLFDTKLNLAELKKETNTTQINQKQESFQVNVTISKTGSYQWVSEFADYPMSSVENIQKELQYQYKLGLIPQDKEKVEILLHIDKDAPWISIAKLIFGMREIGFEARPLYKAEKDHEAIVSQQVAR